MKSDADIVKELAKDLCNRIIRKSISNLQKITDTLSGEGSGLKNSWDEICVQMQQEESIYWDAYDQTTRAFVLAYIEDLKPYEKLALWLQTEAGWEWECEDIEMREKQPPVTDDDIKEYIIQNLYSVASDWSNKRIKAYINRRYLD